MSIVASHRFLAGILQTTFIRGSIVDEELGVLIIYNTEQEPVGQVRKESQLDGFGYSKND